VPVRPSSPIVFWKLVPISNIFWLAVLAAVFIKVTCSFSNLEFNSVLSIPSLLNKLYCFKVLLKVCCSIELCFKAPLY
jgi:hypothetical protein